MIHFFMIVNIHNVTLHFAEIGESSRPSAFHFRPMKTFFQGLHDES